MADYDDYYDEDSNAKSWYEQPITFGHLFGSIIGILFAIGTFWLLDMIF